MHFFLRVYVCVCMCEEVSDCVLGLFVCQSAAEEIRLCFALVDV